MKKIFSVFIGITILSSTTWAGGLGDLVGAVKTFSERSKAVTDKTPPWPKMTRDGINVFSDFLNTVKAGHHGNSFRGPNRMSFLTTEGGEQIIHGINYRPDGTVERFAYYVPTSKTSPGTGEIDDDIMRLNGTPGIRRKYNRHGKEQRTEHYKVEDVGGTSLRTQQDEEIILEYRDGTDYFGEVTKNPRGLHIKIFEREVGKTLETEIAFPEKLGKVVRFRLTGRGRELSVVVAKDKDTMIEYTYGLKESAEGKKLKAVLEGEARELNPLQIQEGQYEGYLETYEPYVASSVKGLDGTK